MARKVPRRGNGRQIDEPILGIEEEDELYQEMRDFEDSEIQNPIVLN